MQTAAVIRKQIHELNLNTSNPTLNDHKRQKKECGQQNCKDQKQNREKNKTNLASLALKASNTTRLAELSESHPDTEGFIQGCDIFPTYVHQSEATGAVAQAGATHEGLIGA